jgi:hypothetical protein
MRERKLRRGVNWKRALKQNKNKTKKITKESGQKQGLGLYIMY